MRRSPTPRSLALKANSPAPALTIRPARTACRRRTPPRACRRSPFPVRRSLPSRRSRRPAGSRPATPLRRECRATVAPRRPAGFPQRDPGLTPPVRQVRTRRRLSRPRPAETPGLRPVWCRLQLRLTGQSRRPCPRPARKAERPTAQPPARRAGLPTTHRRRRAGGLWPRVPPRPTGHRPCRPSGDSGRCPCRRGNRCASRPIHRASGGGSIPSRPSCGHGWRSSPSSAA